MKKKTYKFLLLLIILVLIAINYNYLNGFATNNFSNQRTISVERVIDGDTIVDTDDLHYRMLGINNKTV
jgi:hypothetical protein